MDKVTLFSWGYWGWGNSPKTFVDAVDLIELRNGFMAPIFVDIRLHRNVRSRGFKNDAFEQAAGNYVWMQTLGNASIHEHSRTIRIVEPSAADQLLTLALSSSPKRQRIIFFCACPTPLLNGDVTCHRYEVGTLLLKFARKRAVECEVVEFPGGEPIELDVELPKKEFNRVLAGRLRNISIEPHNHHDVAMLAGLPWCSIVNVYLDSDESCRFSLISGPALYSKKHGWRYPIIYSDPKLNKAELKKKATEIRIESGFEPRS